MTHTITAKDVEAEIPPEAELASRSRAPASRRRHREAA